MSYYVDVPNITKWLMEHGREITKEDAAKVLADKTEVPVAHMTTSTSSFALIAYCDGELRLALRDPLPTVWFAIPKRLVKAFIPLGRR